MTFTIRLKNEVLFHNDVIIKRPSYMSEEEFRSHINDAEKSLGDSYTMQQIVVELEDMGFHIKDIDSSFVTKEDFNRAQVIQISDVEGGIK